MVATRDDRYGTEESLFVGGKALQVLAVIVGILGVVGSFILGDTFAIDEGGFYSYEYNWVLALALAATCVVWAVTTYYVGVALTGLGHLLSGVGHMVHEAGKK